ncbi:MAG: neutral/alkaline non-lysosomal ceramidase N-terminal domain-containing protein [Deltaproteobacteria bacterium]|nr:neutral/alkaline non-lysosomal ceramidase N-terminal domain-containing protein [Deltaproteobacteria bacterium]
MTVEIKGSSPIILCLILATMATILVSATACGGGDDDDDDMAGDDDCKDGFVDKDGYVDCGGGDDDTDEELDDDDDDTTVDDDTTDEPALKVGATRVDVSPAETDMLIMGGYDVVLSEEKARRTTGIHDPLYATAVAFENPDDPPVIMINFDMVGMIITDIDKIREGIAEQLEGVDAEDVVVSSSHSHATPDGVGIWGVIVPPMSGRDEDYIDQLVGGGIQAGVTAWNAREPATLAAATGDFEELHYNSIVGDENAITDDTLTVLVARDTSGNPIASVMNWGCHPMVMGPQNSLVSADFAGAYYKFMDEEIGGVNMFVNGALGASVHPHNLDDGFEIGSGRDWGSWEDVDNYGRDLADATQDLIDGATPVEDTTIKLHHRTVSAPVGNPFFAYAGNGRLIPREVPPIGEVGTTNMTAFSIGEVRFGTIPGELVPTIGVAVREMMGSPYTMLINLGNDWIGYIMTEEQYGSIPYLYNTLLSAGPLVGPTVVDNYMEIFGAEGEAWATK